MSASILVRQHDMHLAAARISRPSVERLDLLGFVRDQFLNFTSCHTGEYHATYRGPKEVPDDELWQEVCTLLENDGEFSGYLEEEANDPEYRTAILGSGERLPAPLGRVALAECGPQLHKACDVHVGVNITASSPEAVAYLEALRVSSVEKPVPEGIRRVFTITFESLVDGQKAYAVLHRRLLRLPGLIGKIKLERIRRYLRKPKDATTLPIATRQAMAEWLANSAIDCPEKPLEELQQERRLP